jgi:hypothetical protein
LNIDELFVLISELHPPLVGSSVVDGNEVVSFSTVLDLQYVAILCFNGFSLAVKVENLFFVAIWSLHGHMSPSSIPLVSNLP